LFLKNEAAASTSPRSTSTDSAALSEYRSPYEKLIEATSTALSFFYRVLTHYEAPGKLREIREGLEEMEEKQLRLLIILGMADGNDPAARSQLLHATDSLRSAKQRYAERSHIYQPVIVRWPSEAIHVDLRWVIGGGNNSARRQLDDESGDPDDITAKLGMAPRLRG